LPRKKLLSDEAVLDAALSVMFRKGPADFTLADVSKECGVAPATLVQRFGGKHELIVRAIAQDNQAFARKLEALPTTQGAASVIAVFRLMTPDLREAETLADQLLWLRLDIRDPTLNALARDRFALLRAAVAARLTHSRFPPLGLARLIEAQWQGALNQWAIAPEGPLVDYVTNSLAAWFTLAGVE